MPLLTYMRIEKSQLPVGERGRVPCPLISKLEILLDECFGLKDIGARAERKE
jgi:hypothetical protein